MESELFGHEKAPLAPPTCAGAASSRPMAAPCSRRDRRHAAETQTRLLRVLADGEFYRVGGHVPVKVDVRIIAATHQNLSHWCRLASSAKTCSTA